MDILKRLLDVEDRAQALVRDADQAREGAVHGALDQVRVAERRFQARIPELRESFEVKARAQAEQELANLRRRYQERHGELRVLAEEREVKAVAAALELLMDPGAG